MKDITGCGDNPCAMGFPPSDIRVVGNVGFLKNNPVIRRLAEEVVIPLEDINEQNASMIDGEDDDGDIQRHAHEWIRKNRGKIEQWLKKANSGNLLKQKATTEKSVGRPGNVEKVLRVVTKRLEPFVVYQNRRYSGFCIDLWKEIAGEMGMQYELYSANSTAKLLDEVKRHAADVAISGIASLLLGRKCLIFHILFSNRVCKLWWQRSMTRPLR